MQPMRSRRRGLLAKPVDQILHVPAKEELNTLCAGRSIPIGKSFAHSTQREGRTARRAKSNLLKTKKKVVPVPFDANKNRLRVDHPSRKKEEGKKDFR